MYFGFGFPRLIAAGVGRDEEWVHLQQDAQFMVAVSETTVSLWSVGLHKLRLSLVSRTEESLELEGNNIAAWWCTSKNALAVLVRHIGAVQGFHRVITDLGICLTFVQTAGNYIHIYQIHGTREPILPGSELAARDIYKADVYLRHTAKLEAAQGLCIGGSSKMLLVGCADGTLASCTWTGKVRGPIRWPRRGLCWLAALADSVQERADTVARSLPSTTS